MKSKLFRNTFLLRLDKGDEIVATLTLFCKKNDIRFASISGIGAADRVTLGYFDLKAKKYRETKFSNESFEILSLSGNTARMNGKPIIHLHIMLADSKSRAFGGHLKAAVISATAEIILTKIDGIAEKALDKKSGLNLFKL